MPELKDRLRALELIPAPDLREGIRTWEPRGPRVEPRRGRAGVILIALVLAAAGIVFAVRAFSGTEQPPRPATTIQNGKIAFAAYSGGHWQIFSVEPDGSERSQLTRLSTDQLQPAWSPDGSRIAFSAQSAEGHTEIDVIDADGSNVEQLTESAGWSYLPGWSPDASRIVFVSNRDGNDEIFVMGADGSNQMRLTDHPGEDLSPAWSPNGTAIAFQSNRDGNNEIFVMSPDGTGVRNLTDAPASGEFDPAWSPDGTKIAFISDRDGNPEIYVMNADGSDVTRLTNDLGHDWNPAWAPDGSRIAFESDRDGSIALYTMEIDSANPVILTDTGADVCCPAWQPVWVSEVPPSPTVLSPRVTATIPVGSFPRDIAVGAGAVWVSVNDFTAGELETHSVLRIDPATNEIVATIPVGTVGNLAVGSDAVWTIDTVDGPQDTVVRIDPTTNRVVGTIPIGPNAFDVAADSSGIWVTRDIDGRGQSGEVIRIDPATNEIVVRIPVEGRTRDVVVGEGGVWVVDSTSTLRRGSSLIHIDPSTNEVVGTIPGLAGLNVATGGGFVWIQGWLSTLDPAVGTGAGDRPLALRIDPATDHVVGDPVPMGFFYPFAFWEGGVWFVGQEAVVSRLNTRTLEIDASIAVGAVAQDSATHAAFDEGTETIWVANYEDTITRVDLK